MSLVFFRHAKKSIKDDWHHYHSHHVLVHVVNVRLEDGLYHFSLDLEGCCDQPRFRGPCLQYFVSIVVQYGKVWQNLKMTKRSPLEQVTSFLEFQTFPGLT